MDNKQRDPHLTSVVIAELQLLHPKCDSCAHWKRLHSAAGISRGLCNNTTRVETDSYYCADHSRLRVF